MSRAGRTIVHAGLAVGILDALDAIVFFGLRRGAPPARIFQGISYGLLGPASFNGGLPTAFLGLGIHFFIAFSVATVYYLASRRIEALRRRPVVWGLLYGVAVYYFMQLVVLPLSLIGRPAFSLPGLLNGLIGHALLVGLPCALLARDR